MRETSVRDTGDILVAHVGRRDRYELAIALTRTGRKVHLATDFYYRPETFFGKISKLLFGSGVFKRHRSDLSATVHTSLSLLCLDFIERIIPRNKVVNRLRGYALGRLCCNVADNYKISDAYFYTNSGLRKFSKLNSSTCRINLFQMHPHADSLKEIYNAYMAYRPQPAALLTSQEEELTENPKYLSLLREEAKLADRVICTSSFVQASLLKCGIKIDRMTVIPYGAQELSMGSAIPAQNFGSRHQYQIRLAFVGQFVIRKGVYELALFAQNNPHVELSVFTRETDYARSITKNWLGGIPRNIIFQKILNDDQLWATASKCDFLILPSLAEGFGLVILESMIHGLPVIASKNSSALDLISDCKNGILLDDVFDRNIEDAIKKAIELKCNWPSMRIAAHQLAKTMSWERFQLQLLDFAQSCKDS